MARPEIEATVMDVRQQLMNYFKGTYVDNVVRNSNIYMNNYISYARSIRFRHNYQRDEYRRQNKQIMILGEAPILQVQHYPDTLTYYNHVFKSTAGLTELREEIQKFMKRYLPYVKTKSVSKFDKRLQFNIPELNDKNLFKAEPYIKQKRTTEDIAKLSKWMGIPQNIIESMMDHEYDHHLAMLNLRNSQVTQTYATTYSVGLSEILWD